MENLKLPCWPDEASDVFSSSGLLDGLPPPTRSSGLDFLLGRAGGQGRALTIGHVDPDRLVLGRPEGNYHSVPGAKNPIGPVQGYPETGKNSWRASNDDVIVEAVNIQCRERVLAGRCGIYDAEANEGLDDARERRKS